MAIPVLKRLARFKARARYSLDTIKLGVRAIYEYPFFLLLVACMHAGIKNLHDALIEIVRDKMLGTVLREFRKLAEAYERLYNIERNHVVALTKLASKVKNDFVRRFLYGYLTSSIVHGDPLQFMEDVSAKLPQQLELTMKSNLEIVAAVVEAIVIVTTVLAFLLLMAGCTITTAIIVPLLVLPAMAIMPLVRVPVYELLLPSMRRLELFISISGIATSVIILIVYGAGLLQSLEHPPVIACTVALAAVMVVNAVKTRREMFQLLNILTSLVEALRMTTQTTEKVLARIVMDEKLASKSTLANYMLYSLRTGRPPLSLSGNSNYVLLNFFTSLVSVVMRSGVYASRIASIAYEVILSLENIFRETTRRALVYEVILGIALVLLSSSLIVSTKLLTGLNTFMLQAQVGYSFSSPLPLAASEASIRAGVVVLGLVCLIADLGVAYALRGSPLRAYLTPLIPILCALSIHLSSAALPLFLSMFTFSP